MNTAADLVERSVHETLTYYAFPDIHWHVHVAFGGPCGPRDVAQSCRGEVEARLAIGECTDNTSPSTDLSHDPFERVVGADLVMRPLYQPQVVQTEAVA